VARTEYRVARLELCHVFADRFNSAADIHAESCVLWTAQPDLDAHAVRRTTHKVPVQRVDGSRGNFDQDVVVGGIWLFNFFQLQGIRGTIVVVDDRLHGQTHFQDKS
jgi:hypothetical protein